MRVSANRYSPVIITVVSIFIFLLIPELAVCSDLASNLARVQRGILGTLFPAVGTLGLIWGAISFTSGNPAGRGHLIMGFFGLVIGFTAPSVVTFIQSMFVGGGAA